MNFKSSLQVYILSCCACHHSTLELSTAEPSRAELSISNSCGPTCYYCDRTSALLTTLSMRTVLVCCVQQLYFAFCAQRFCPIICITLESAHAVGCSSQTLVLLTKISSSPVQQMAVHRWWTAQKGKGAFPRSAKQV